MRKMRFIKYILLFCITILILILFYSWIMDQIIKIDYPSLRVSLSSFSNFKVNEKTPNPTLRNIKKSFVAKAKEDTFIKRKEFYRCFAPNCMVLSTVCCGNKCLNGTSTMIKSAIILSKAPLIIELFTEKDFFPYFKSLELSWPDSVRERVKINLNEVHYPTNINEKTWINLFSKCASIRLFIPSLLQDVEALLYVDTDVLFMGPLESVWHHFNRMNASHMAALTPEHEDAATGWYNRFAKHPYFGKLGVNSGVMLMNLTRLRNFKWESYVVSVQKEFRSALTWGDQDIINIIFHYHPDKLYVMGCEYNYRTDHCMYLNTCLAIDRVGVYVLHGSRRTFITEKQPIFKAIYNAWQKFDFADDLRQDFYYPVSKYFIVEAPKSNCGKLRKQFLKNIEKMIIL